MTRITTYIVLSMDRFRDQCGWSEHRTLADARDIAAIVRGTIYRRTITIHAEGRRKETWRRIEK
jgi:hypothetical protein